jgi:hypothetical protein
MTFLALLLLLAAEPLAQPPAATAEPRAPVFATSGFTRPSEAQKGCVARQIRLPGEMAGSSGTVTVKFAVELDGSVSRFEPLSDAPDRVAAAIWQAVKECQFTPGRDPKGAPLAVWMILPIRFQSDAPPSPPAAGTPPSEAEAGCIGKQLHYRFPPNRLLHGLLVIRVAMTAEGKPGAIVLPPGLPDDVANAFKLSIEGCSYRPATGSGGQAVAGSFEYRVSFASRLSLVAAAARSASPGSAKLASTTCLQRLKSFGVIGHAVVQVKVTAAGEPTNFRLQPENVPAELRLHIFDVLATCKWEPAIGLDDRPVDADTVLPVRYR